MIENAVNLGNQLLFSASFFSILDIPQSVVNCIRDTMCELTRKFIRMVGRLRPDHSGEFVGFSDLFEPRSGSDKSLDTTLVG